MDYKDFVVQDEKFYRPAEVDQLVGDPTKAREKLGWRPEYNFDQLITEMVQSDLENARRSLGQAEAVVGS